MSDAVQEKKPRSPVERVVVWGLILVLLGLLAFEGWAKVSYDRSLSALTDEFKASEESGEDVTLTRARTLLAGSATLGEPEKQGSQFVRSAKWPSLFRTYQIDLRTNSVEDDAIVFQYSTPEYVEPEKPEAPVGDPLPLPGAPSTTTPAGVTADSPGAGTGDGKKGGGKKGDGKKGDGEKAELKTQRPPLDDAAKPTDGKETDGKNSNDDKKDPL